MNPQNLHFLSKEELLHDAETTKVAKKYFSTFETATQSMNAISITQEDTFKQT